MGETPTFLGKKVTLDEGLAMTHEERDAYQTEALNKNQEWIEHQLDLYGAEWVMIIDGEVVKHGVSLEDYPRDELVLSTGRKYNKFPYVFARNPIIKESSISSGKHLCDIVK
ncbi:hypothetical protein HYU07_06540 [Candidatus Woesearchaeota archaeon]|nr:hypothetical protein [Candidatus Woesearchaeota archaeon]